jgi:hypothetical protein
MSPNFPEGPHDGTSPPLTPSTFVDCMAALEDALTEGLSVYDATILNRWYTYAADGDVSALPTQDGMVPWQYLKAVCGQKLQNSAADLDTDQKELIADWHSDSSGKFTSYLGKMRDQMINYSGAAGNSGGSAGTSGGGWVDQVAAQLESAYTVQVAFKKDLYEIAHATYKALKNVDDPFTWSNTKKIGLLLGAVASVAVGAGGAIAMASEWGGMVFAQTVGSAATTIGQYAFQTVADNMSIGGDDDAAVYASMDAAVTTALGHYKTLAQKVTATMDDLWPSLNHAASHPPRYGTVASTDTVNSAQSFNSSNYFPNAGQT